LKAPFPHFHPRFTTLLQEGQGLNENIQSIFSALKPLCTHIASGAKPDVKVLVTGPFTNTCCLIVSELAPGLPKQNITGLSRLEYNRSVHCLSSKTDSPCESVRNITLWGEVGKTGWPDASYCTIKGRVA
jgi:malate/lactate dehydrogenase